MSVIQQPWNEELANRGIVVKVALTLLHLLNYGSLQTALIHVAYIMYMYIQYYHSVQ